MRRLVIHAVLVAAVLASACAGASAQEWLLNHEASRFYMQTVKANSILETHRFSGLDGGVSRQGDAVVKIDLTSVASGVDVRDVRMRFLLFETFKFPHAEITAKLDMGQLQEVVSKTRITYPLKFALNLHGHVREIETPVTVTRIGDKSVSVASAMPVIINADQFGFVAGIAKLSEAVGGIPIATAASFTFDLIFETGEKVAEIEVARREFATRKVQEETSIIGAEGCETRFSVISTTRVINFRTGSAELDGDSEPMLNSVADIAKRCPTSRFQVTGHGLRRRSTEQAGAVRAAGAGGGGLPDRTRGRARAHRGGGLRGFQAGGAER
jgi:OOP family OmpA-OmpF porin